MAVSRKYVDPVTGIVYANQAERSRAINARESQQGTERHNANVRNTVSTDNARAFAQQEIALSNTRRVIDESSLTGIDRARALASIDRVDAALHTPNPRSGGYAFSDTPSYGLPLGTTRTLPDGSLEVSLPIGFVGVMDGNRPQNRPAEGSVDTECWRLVREYWQRTGCTLEAAINHVQTERRDLALRHGQEVNAAVDRHAAERSAKWTQHDEQQLSNMVEARMAKTGESFGAALAEISRSNLQMFERRRLALSQPINLR